jgi:hypothetical protein
MKRFVITCDRCQKEFNLQGFNEDNLMIRTKAGFSPDHLKKYDICDSCFTVLEETISAFLSSGMLP